MYNCCNLIAELSVGQGERGRSLEFTWEGTSLGVRVEGDIEYQFVDLGAEGGSGKEVQLQVSNGYIQWKYADEEEWKNLISISELKGDRGLDGKSAYDLWLENGNEGTVEDFLNSLKGKDGEKGEQGDKGDTGEQGLPGGNGKDGITPNITIGTVTTLESNQQATVENVGTLENPVFNFGIPKGEDGTGSGGVSINDNNISKDETWSSSKIEDFVLTNDDVVWTEVSGENLSIDYTKEGYLREVEIWGNTIQNEEDLSDIQHLGELYVDDEGEPILDELGREQYKIEVVSHAKNIWNGIFPFQGKLNAETGEFEETNGYRVTDFIRVKENTLYGFTSSFRCNVYYYDKNKNFLSVKTGTPPSFTTVQGTDFIRLFKLNTQEFTTYGIIEGKNTNDYVEYIENKTIIFLPCQLMKVGDVYDRLYWDSEKGRYVVEKKVDIPEDYSQVIDESLVLEVPQLIETNITEQIKLPTYINKTHIFVSGNIDGSIKCEVPLDGNKVALQTLQNEVTKLSEENKELQEVNQQQDELINISLLATDEMFMMLEPLLVNVIDSLNIDASPLINIYVAMCQRGLKDRNEVSIKYREQVIEILNKLEN